MSGKAGCEAKQRITARGQIPCRRLASRTASTNLHHFAMHSIRVVLVLCLVGLATGCQNPVATDLARVTPGDAEMTGMRAIPAEYYAVTRKERLEKYVSALRSYPDEWKVQRSSPEGLFVSIELNVTLPARLQSFPPPPLKEPAVVRFTVLVDDFGFPHYPTIERVSPDVDLAVVEDWLKTLRFRPAHVVGKPVTTIISHALRLQPGLSFAGPTW